MTTITILRMAGDGTVSIQRTGPDGMGRPPHTYRPRPLARRLLCSTVNRTVLTSALAYSDGLGRWDVTWYPQHKEAPQ